MATNIEIPTQAGQPFSESVTLQGVAYTLQFLWNTVMQCWTVDFYDATGTVEVLLGVPLVTGSDLLEQYGYLTLGAYAVLTAMTIGPGISPDSVPSFTNLGIDGHLYVTTP